jgi:hypothetical protein
MKTTTTTLRLAAALLLTLASSVGIVACGGDDNAGNPGPTPHDGGMDNTNPMNDAHPGNDVANDTPNPTDSPNDTNPNCMSDAATCNSCVTPMQDPYNACSSYTANCIPFMASRVPTHPML